jgi:hypothetical protein
MTGRRSRVDARYARQWNPRTFIPRPMGTKLEKVPSRWNVMLRRTIAAFATLIALSQAATAGVPSCAVVRFYVAKYSEAAAEKWARSHGAGDTEIETARRCLHSANVQIASSAARSQVLAPVTEQERPKREPADHDALNVVPAKVSAPTSGQDNHDNEPSVSRPKDTLRPSYVGAVHRAHSAGVTSHVSWIKRLWHDLTRRRQFSVAFLHFRGGQR